MSLSVFLFIDIFAIKHLTLHQRDSSLFTFHSSFSLNVNNFKSYE